MADIVDVSECHLEEVAQTNLNGIKAWPVGIIVM